MSDCIEHTYSVGTSGYSNTTVNYKWVTRHVKAWQEFTGFNVPKGGVIRHSCSNKKCINPHHLTLGTMHQNNQDKILNNEMPKGEKHYNSKLDTTQVTEIKSRLMKGEHHHLIAADYGVGRITITDINIGKTWGHVKV